MITQIDFSRESDNLFNVSIDVRMPSGVERHAFFQGDIIAVHRDVVGWCRLLQDENFISLDDFWKVVNAFEGMMNVFGYGFYLLEESERDMDQGILMEILPIDEEDLRSSPLAGLRPNKFVVDVR